MTSVHPDASDDRSYADARRANRHRRPRPASRRGMVLATAAAVGVVLIGGGYLVFGRHDRTAVADEAGHAATAVSPKSAAVNPAAPRLAAPGPAGPLPDRDPRARPKDQGGDPRRQPSGAGRLGQGEELLRLRWSPCGPGPPTATGSRAPPGPRTTRCAAGPPSTTRAICTALSGCSRSTTRAVSTPTRAPSCRTTTRPPSAAGGVGFDGEPLDAAFDYVIAIDYNRVAGTSPLDGTQPLGANRGGGIWVHVDHGGPTHGCVSIPAARMVDLLRTLLPADHPVIVMGDRASLAT